MDDPLHDRTILVIDDEPQILERIEVIFSKAGARVVVARDAHEGLRQFYACRPDLVLLDIMLPGMDGWQVCQRLRELSAVPIMMLTALDDDQDITRGLDAGADDYITKPFANQVLLARARALLRRAAQSPASEPPRRYDDGHLTIDLEWRRVLVRQQPVKLTPTEYKLLTYLFQHGSRVLSHEQILKQVWGPECLDATQYIHIYVHRLRSKLEADPANPQYLLTEPGVGYRFEQRVPPGH